MKMIVNKDLLEVQVVTSPGEGFMPDERSIAVGKLMEKLRKDRDDYYDGTMMPQLKRVLGMVEEFNRAHAPAPRAKTLPPAKRRR